MCHLSCAERHGLLLVKRDAPIHSGSNAPKQDCSHGVVMNPVAIVAKVKQLVTVGENLCAVMFDKRLASKKHLRVDFAQPKNQRSKQRNIKDHQPEIYQMHHCFHHDVSDCFVSFPIIYACEDAQATYKSCECEKTCKRRYLWRI